VQNMFAHVINCMRKNYWTNFVQLVPLSAWVSVLEHQYGRSPVYSLHPMSARTSACLRAIALYVHWVDFKLICCIVPGKKSKHRHRYFFGIALEAVLAHTVSPSVQEGFATHFGILRSGWVEPRLKRLAVLEHGKAFETSLKSYVGSSCVVIYSARSTGLIAAQDSVSVHKVNTAKKSEGVHGVPCIEVTR
jgi:hypothetical protein